ncbi:MAG TPA: dienelactone hydrolase family protein [Acidimicrobiales bacterium]|jgi:carboxymethylenebutenolidase|nr:dienelactone hydrolase family protein [Acidimicrobiales bacterium]
MDPKRAGTGYLAVPDETTGPGILVLHAWWGLTPFFKAICDRLAAAGFVALAPDLLGGDLASTIEEAEQRLEAANADELAHLTRSSLWHLRQLPMTPDAPLGVLGFSMGASMALWLSAREADDVAATAIFYGAQDIDFAGSRSAYLGHFADEDPYVDEDSLVLLEADLRLLDLDTTFHRYPGTRHWFFEEDRPEHDPTAAALAWERTLQFFRQHLQPEG